MFPFFSLFNCDIPSYGTSIFLGLIIGNFLLFFQTKSYSHKYSFDLLILMEAVSFLGGIIGAKLGHIILFPEYYFSENSSPIEMMDKGFVFYTGLFGALLFLLIYKYISNDNVIDYLNHFAFIIPFFHSFGRVGCLLSGCCYGIEYQGIFFVSLSHSPDIHRFPVQLAEAIFLLLLSLFLYQRSKKTNKNNIFYYMLIYGVARFFLEFLRADNEKVLFFLTVSQLISISMIFILIFFLTIKTSSHH